VTHKSLNITNFRGFYSEGHLADFSPCSVGWSLEEFAVQAAAVLLPVAGHAVRDGALLPFCDL